MNKPLVSLDVLCAGHPKLAELYQVEPQHMTKLHALAGELSPTYATLEVPMQTLLLSWFSTKHVTPGDLKSLLDFELKARALRESERRRVLDAFHILMRDPADWSSKASGKVEPKEEALRKRARSAVIDWLEHRDVSIYALLGTDDKIPL